MAKQHGPVRSMGTGSFVRILLIAFINATSVHAIRPMASYRALELGADPLELGLIASSYALLAMFGSFLVGAWTDRLGPRRFLVFGSLLICVAAVSGTWINSILAIAVGQALLGLGQISNVVAAQTYVANNTSRRSRDTRFGFYATVASAGQFAGPAIAGLIAGGIVTGGHLEGITLFPVFMLTAALATTSATLSALWLRPARTRGRPGKVGADNYLVTARAMANQPGIPAALAVGIAVMMGVDLLVAYLPALGEQNRLPVELVGILLSLRAAGSMTSRLLMGVLIEKLGRGRLLVISMLLAGSAIALLPTVREPLVLAVLMLLIGLGLGVGQPLTIAIVANGVPRELRGAALGLRLSGSRLGQLVLPTAMGALANAAGLSALFWVLAVVLGGGALLVRRSRIDSAVGAGTLRQDHQTSSRQAETPDSSA